MCGAQVMVVFTLVVDFQVKQFIGRIVANYINWAVENCSMLLLTVLFILDVDFTETHLPK